MVSNWTLAVGSVISLLLLDGMCTLAEAKCLEIQSQTLKYVQFSTNTKRQNNVISVAINCCPDNECCPDGIFESGRVFKSDGKCIDGTLLQRAGTAQKCEDSKNKNLPANQRRATVTGVKNGYSLYCLTMSKDGSLSEDEVSIKIKVLPKLLSLTKKVIEKPKRGILLTCKAALGTYQKDSVDLSFMNYSSPRSAYPIGKTYLEKKISRELTGADKNVALYLKNELNVSALNEVELQHFIPDEMVFWRNLSVGCELSMARKEIRADRVEFDSIPRDQKQKTYNEKDLKTLPKVNIKYDTPTGRLKCSIYSYPDATSVKWTYAVARGQNFSDIPTVNTSATRRLSNDWYSSWFNGPFEPKSVYRCIVRNSVGESVGELEFTTTTSVAVTTTKAVENLVDMTNNHWQGPPPQEDGQFPFYWVIVVVGILIIFAVAIAVILHLRKRGGSEYKSSKRGGDGGEDDEQQRLQGADVASGSNEMAETKTAPSTHSPQDGQNTSKSSDIV